MIRIPETSDETFNKLLEFGKNMGKVTVNCKVRILNVIYILTRKGELLEFDKKNIFDIKC